MNIFQSIVNGFKSIFWRRTPDYMKHLHNSSSEALKHDWEMVGQDVKRAMERAKRELRDNQQYCMCGGKLTKTIGIVRETNNKMLILTCDQCQAVYQDTITKEVKH